MSDALKCARDNRANQLNPIHPAYYLSRGASPDEAVRLAECRIQRQQIGDCGPDVTGTACLKPLRESPKTPPPIPALAQAE